MYSNSPFFKRGKSRGEALLSEGGIGILDDRPLLDRPHDSSEGKSLVGNEYYSERKLRWFTGITSVLHLGGFIATLALNKDQLVPLTKGYVIWPKQGTVNGKFTFGSESASKISLAMLIASFFFLSFAFQFLTIINLRVGKLRINIWDTYITKLTMQSIQPYRWIEYSFSAACLFVMGSLINGVTDLYHVMLIFAGIWTVMMLGLMQENVAFYLRKLEAASISNRNIVEFFMPHLIGWVLYLFLWSEQLDRFRLDLKHSPSKPPAWVYSFYIVNFIIFSSFGFNQFTQMVRLYRLRADDAAGLRVIALKHEFVYVFLSLTAKSLSGYFLLSGMLASSSAASY